MRARPAPSMWVRPESPRTGINFGSSVVTIPPYLGVGTTRRQRNVVVEMTPERAGAILLAGGSSRRLGVDKARLPVEGVALARRVAEAVIAVSDLAIEVGPGASGLEYLQESPEGEGPLVAIACGAAALRRRGRFDAVLVVAADLPFIRAAGLRELVEWTATGSVVPLVDGRAQPLCARWSTSDLKTAEVLVANGERAVRALVAATHPTMIEVGVVTTVLDAQQLADLDTREDARRLGVEVDSV
jgi:molybdenum cofactor guanylyltransferase